MFGEAAAVAEGVGVEAEVLDDLEESLLSGGGAEAVFGTGAEEAFAGAAEDDVILTCGPGQVSAFGFLLEGFVGSGESSGPEPGEDDVDSQVGDAGLSEQRLGVAEPGGFEGPMPGPEGVVGHAEDFAEGLFGLGCGGPRLEPGFEAVREV